jgi:threonine aldolase
VSLQFLELFRDNLYFEIARHANDLAEQLEGGIRECGYQILVEAQTNQVFPILPNRVIERLQQDYGFHVWEKMDAQNSVIRLVTSWATRENAVSEFLSTLRTCVQETG